MISFFTITLFFDACELLLFLQVGLLYEEKILPLGKDVTAVGMCNLKNGILEIKSCKDLPYFLYVNFFFYNIYDLLYWIARLP